MHSWLEIGAESAALHAPHGVWLSHMTGPREPAVPEGKPQPSVRVSFAARYATEADAVGRLCRRLLGRDGSADDAAQEVFLRAQRGYAGYDPEQSFRTWLLSIASHHCIDVLRRRGREGQIFQAADFDPGDLGAVGPSPLGHALDAERRKQLLAAVEALPDRYRVPLVLRYFQELDYAAIAATLDLSRENVGVLLFRARRRLRDRLEGGDS